MLCFDSNVLLWIHFWGQEYWIYVSCYYAFLSLTIVGIKERNATWWFSHRMLWVKICSVFVVRPFCRRSSHTSWAHMTDTTNIHYFIQNHQQKSWLLGGRDFNHFNHPAVSIDVFFPFPNYRMRMKSAVAFLWLRQCWSGNPRAMPLIATADPLVMHQDENKYPLVICYIAIENHHL